MIKPLWGSLSTNQYFMESKAVIFFGGSDEISDLEQTSYVAEICRQETGQGDTSICEVG